MRDLLYRFRPAGAPGAASAAGVPVDRAADTEAELAPLLAALTDTEGACARILEQARRDAEAIRVREAQRARDILTTASARSGAERAAATARIGQVVRDEATALLTAADEEAAAIRERAAERMPEHVGLLVASVRALLGGHESGTGAA